MNELITPEEATMSKRKSNKKVKQMIEDCWAMVASSTSCVTIGANTPFVNSVRRVAAVLFH